MSKNVFLNKVIATTAVQTNQIDEEHIEAKEYVCANPLAIYGSSPRTVPECLEKFFPGYTQNAALNDMVAKLRPSKPPISSDKSTGLLIYEEDPEPDGCTLTCAFTETKMCDDIKEKMGDTFLGCFYSEPNAPFSCDCPSFGKDFPKLLNIAIKNSTFWNTPLEAPLVRRAFLAFLNATKVKVTVDGNFSIRPGYSVFINDPGNSFSGSATGKLHGFWVITAITHTIFKDRHHESTLTLARHYTEENSANTNTIAQNLPDLNIQR